MLPSLILVPLIVTRRILRNRTIRVKSLAAVACIFFFLAGLAMAPLLGIEADETLFIQGIYSPRAELYALHIGSASIPLMLMNYVGALKSWLYPRILHSFGANVITLRIPMVLAGAISIWLFFLLLRRIAGERAALVGCTLLAVDSAYLLSLCFDWGPVALQHLLLIGGMLSVVKFYQDKKPWALAAGFFLFGLALWDKALAIWMLSGLGLAAILVFPQQLFSRLDRRSVAIAVLAFVLGAFPLLVYNAGHHWVTFAGNFHRDTSELAGKARMLRDTAEGRGLFGWMTAEDWQTPHPHPPNGPIEQHFCRYIGTCPTSPPAPAAVRLRSCAPARPACGTQRHPGDRICLDHDGRDVDSDGDYLQRRGQRPSHHPLMAVSGTGDCGSVRRRLAPAGARRNPGAGHRAHRDAGFRRARDERVLCSRRAQRRGPELEQRHLSPLATI